VDAQEAARERERVMAVAQVKRFPIDCVLALSVHILLCADVDSQSASALRLRPTSMLVGIPMTLLRPTCEVNIVNCPRKTTA
jgi:hypothetical protein